MKPSKQPPQEVEERLGTLVELEAWLRTPMLVLSALWLVLVVAELAWGENLLLSTLGTVIWVIFLIEFALRLALAPDRLAFLRANWLSVIALIAPAFRLLRGIRVLRFARAARGLRLVRVVGTANRGMNALRGAMRRRGLGYVLALTGLVNLLGAAGMYAFERAPEVEGGFSGFADALWWTSMVLTTMGSAYWPVTAEGRVLCLMLSVYAFAVFGYITAAFASFFVGRDAEERTGGAKS
ncbi:ion transporter [Sabulicella glaciei]|uniref:Ion transporter n=1 Tax=Sabulicella glaciei TaxID=2984948 RepID=A0ABT3P284_9PROT|nr:ion transporter [Roseococcus sp. MDT2-1-1]MCW8088528.1 ion transporter [Roseococcus sp. MDT2-1-1]